MARLASALFLLLGLLASPGGGLAHGLAHLREAHHREAHEGRDAAALDAASHDARAVEDAGHHRDHAHGRVDDGIRPRADGLTLLRAEPVVVPVAHVIGPTVRLVLPRATLPRADPATGPPPRPRSPPAV